MDISGGHNCEVLTASTGSKPGMQLSVRRPLDTYQRQNPLAQQVSSAEAERPSPSKAPLRVERPLCPAGLGGLVSTGQSITLQFLGWAEGFSSIGTAENPRAGDGGGDGSHSELRPEAGPPGLRGS